ncbi:hypothetical protein U8D42_15190 [Mycobacterium europaeum]|nr:hypothetical protein [Mycobacterium europaeum]MEA1160192.1 hypothetical protein [Mycobacterium europaeum]
MVRRRPRPGKYDAYDAYDAYDPHESSADYQSRDPDECCDPDESRDLNESHESASGWLISCSATAHICVLVSRDIVRSTSKACAPSSWKRSLMMSVAWAMSSPGQS